MFLFSDCLFGGIKLFQGSSVLLACWSSVAFVCAAFRKFLYTHLRLSLLYVIILVDSYLLKYIIPRFHGFQESLT